MSWHTSLCTTILTTLASLGAIISPEVVLANGLANAFEPPPRQDAPQSTAGGGSRPTADYCGWDTSSSTSPIAPIALTSQSFVGRSSASRPILWLYLPSTTIQSIEFSLFDEELNGLVQTNLPAPAASGPYAIPFPEDFSLAPEQNYYWAAALVCNPRRRTEDWVVGGWIKYQPIADNLVPVADVMTFQNDQVSLETELLEEQISQYVQTGYWYDALTTMLLLMQKQSLTPPLEQSWVTVLEQAGLTPTDVNLDVHLNDHARFSH